MSKEIFKKVVANDPKALAEIKLAVLNGLDIKYEMNEAEKCLVLDYYNKFKKDKYSNINVKKEGNEVSIRSTQPGLKASIPEIKDLLSYAKKNGYVETERDNDYSIMIKKSE